MHLWAGFRPTYSYKDSSQSSGEWAMDLPLESSGAERSSGNDAVCQIARVSAL